MSAGITSRDAIMQACRRIAAERGLTAVSMRAVAHESHIALGTLYNYYADKDELVLATVESIWRDIFHADPADSAGLSFPQYVETLFSRIQRGAAQYPGFLTAHSFAIATGKRGEARSIMERSLRHMQDAMMHMLRSDPSVDPSVFTPSFTQETFAGMVFDQLLLMLMRRQTDCAPLTQLIRRVLYR